MKLFSTVLLMIFFVPIQGYAGWFSGDSETTKAQQEEASYSDNEMKTQCHNFLKGFRDRLGRDFQLKSAHFKMKKHCLTGASHLIGTGAGRECDKVKKDHLSQVSDFKKYREDLFNSHIRYQHGKFMAASMSHKNGRDGGALTSEHAREMWKKFEKKQGRFIQSWFKKNGDKKVPGWKDCFVISSGKLVYQKDRGSEIDVFIRDVLRPEFNRKNSSSIQCRKAYRSFRKVQLGQEYSKKMRIEKKKNLGAKKDKFNPRPWMLIRKKTLQGLSSDKQLRGIASSYSSLEGKMDSLKKTTSSLKDNDLYKLLVFKDRFLAEGGNPKCLKRPGVSRVTRVGEFLVEDLVPFVNMYYASSKHKGMIDANESGVAGVTNEDVQRGRREVVGAALVSGASVIPIGKLAGPTTRVVGGAISNVKALRGAVYAIRAANIAQRKVVQSLVKNSGIHTVEKTLLKHASRYPVSTAAGRARRRVLQTAAASMKKARFKAFKATGRLTAEEAEQLAESTVHYLQESGLTDDEIFALFKES